MQKPVLIVKNITREGPGMLEGLLTEKGIASTVVDLSQGEAFPEMQGYGAVIVLGGPDSANDATPKMTQELSRIAEVIDQGIPYMGICLGLQTLVKAVGGTVVRNPVREIGFHMPSGEQFTIELTEDGKNDPLFVGLPDVLPVFQLHGETVTLTQHTKLLATGELCANQAVRVGTAAYGLQCHFELTREMFDLWLEQDDDLRVMDKDKLVEAFVTLQEQYTEIGRKLFANFLTIAGY